MWVPWLATVAVACDYVLQAMPGDTNIWVKVQELAPVQSPYVLCLTGSSSTRRFNLDDSSAGCVWATHLIITNLCEADLCDQQTIWLKGSQSCKVSHSLTFVNVTLSGRHYFSNSCEEDWCTHCLNPELLAEEQGAYFTVIEHHPVLFDASYEAWQAKCLWGQSGFVFEVLEGATLSIEDSMIADVRSKVQSFVRLDNASLRLVRCQVLRMDPGNNVIEDGGVPGMSVLIQDCWVTGLNRDHVYYPEVSADGGLFSSFQGSSFTVANSSFTDLIMQTSQSIMADVYVDSFHLTNTTFARCVVQTLLFLQATLANNTVNSVVFLANYAYGNMLWMADAGTLNIVGCSFIDNQSRFAFLDASLQALTSGVFRNNRMMGGGGQFVLFYFGAHSDFRMENTVFEGNMAMDDTFEAYWSDYYLAQGLLTDTGLSSAKALDQNSSSCAVVVDVACSHEFSMTNISITDGGSSCAEELMVITTPSSFTLLQLSDVRISSQAQIAVDITCVLDVCTVLIQDCRFEWASQLLSVMVSGAEGVLVVANVTFQYAELGTAAVELFNCNSTFLHCSWSHNQGQLAGALLLSYGNTRVLESHFLNNSCWGGAGDVYLTAGYNNNVSLEVSSCTFTASNSFLNAASMWVTGTIDPSSVSHCTFTQSLSTAGSVLKATHNSGSLLLSSLTFLDIYVPSALLILVTVPASQAVPAITSIEDLQVRNCTFYRGLVTNLGEPQVSSRHSNFTDNNGALLWIKSGHFSDFGSVYLYNTSPSLCFFGSQTVGSVEHSLFQGNSLSDTTGLLYVEGPQVVVSLHNCTLTDNVAEVASGLVQLQVRASVVLHACHFSGNRVLRSLYFLQHSTLSVQHCTHNHTWDPLQLNNSTALVLATSFTHTHTRTGSFALVRSSLTLQDVSLTHTQGTGNCLLSALASSVSMANVSIQDLSCTKEAVLLTNSTLSMQSVDMSVVSARTVFSSTQAQLDMNGVHLTQCSAPVLSAQNSSVTLIQSEFSHIHSQQPTLLTCSNCLLLAVLNSTWTELSAQAVGAISVSAVQVTIRYSSFVNISARDTGALLVSAGSFQLSHCTFSNTTATGPSSRGGALCLSGGNSAIVSSSFEYCRAWTGGAVQWLSGSLAEQDNSFRENTAGAYGPSWASFPSSLHTSTPVLYQSTLLVSLVDHFGQIVLSESSSQATLVSTQSSALGGRLQAVASNGQFLFDGFSVFAKPSSSFTITVTANNLTLEVTFVQRACEVGEIETTRSCERCQAGTFSLVLPATACTPCPEGAECNHGNLLFPKPGYWRPQRDFPGVLQCPWPEACVGHDNYTSQTGVCAELYAGRLCQTCGEGGCRSGRDRCVSCPNLPLQAGIVSVGLPVLWGLQAWTRSPLLRLLVDYLQLTVLVVDYDLFWPQVLQDFYSLHRYLGNAAFLPLDYSHAFFVSTVAASLAPVVIGAFFLGCWGVLWLGFQVCKCSVTGLRGVCVNAIVAGVAYVYPFLVRVFLSAFLCETIEGEQWLRADLAVACWDKRHMTYALAVCLPALLLWGVSVPALTSLYLLKGKQIDFLSSGLQAQWYLWEVGICVFKVLVAVLYVFTATLLACTQALIVVLALALAFLLQRTYRPYQGAVSNRVALLSAAVVWATAYAGALCSASGPSTVLVVLVLGLQGWFFLLWMAAVCRTKFPLLWLLLLRRKEE